MCSVAESSYFEQFGSSTALLKIPFFKGVKKRLGDFKRNAEIQMESR